VVSDVFDVNDYCEEVVKSACQREIILFNQCTVYLDDPNTSKFDSCTCQPAILSLDYTCSFIANTTCYRTGANLGDLPFYSCPNFAAVIGTGLVSGEKLLPRSVANFNLGSPVRQPSQFQLPPRRLGLLQPHRQQVSQLLPRQSLPSGPPFAVTRLLLCF
jgi:hypothetical protein